MKGFDAAEALAATDGRAVGTVAGPLSGVSIDSRRTRRGELFVAIAGERFNGHHYVDDAIAAGARAAVISDERFVPRAGPAILVPDTRRALLAIAAAWRAKLKARVVAVTGSNGKTTVRSMLACILRDRRRVVEAEANFNNDIGIPLTLFRLDRKTEVGVLEIEMNEIGGTRRLADACRPIVGVVTNIGDSHLEMMGDRTNVAREKAELVEALPEDGVAVLNADDALVRETVRPRARCRRLEYGFGPDAEVRADEIRNEGLEGLRFRLQGRYEVRLRLPGMHNVSNCLAACAAAHALGVDYAAMPAALERFEAPAGRLRVFRLAEGITLIDDSYNANPQSMTAAIDLLCHSVPEGRRVAFLGDMLELGSIAMEAHTRLGVRAVGCLDRVAFVGRLGQHALAVAIRRGLKPGRIRLYPDSAAARGEAFDMVRPGDTILVKGSRSTAMDLIAKALLERYGKETAGDH
ncbi:MAG TPA: UDP-N-acetylmuramoyl-tripeptide--D-alanyl-D-alanine ligase [candidate division WOR-3 bacterium]|uniref:UDP-N-acetylmuramoyl-tripeptide--D-alanyl-D-alanine ligase n=1 Tax=candidate division WOR-3 bacterium TaxID=2052148 RepID=A0A7V0T418_UNCW3|nr:UDP-N-acetylmuramoyl-tripeptide--D-alanyl-D-alanine ligase [candidate division WOR-3 bacterium]